MNESRNNSAKEMLLNQTQRCRDRLQFLVTLRDNVVNAIEETCIEITNMIAVVEQDAEAADAARIKQLTKEIRNASNTIRQYENALEKVIDVAETDDDDGRLTFASSIGLDRLVVNRESALSQNGTSQVSAVRRRPCLPVRLPSAAAEPDLVDLSDSDAPLPSPDFQTAESCAASSFTDNTSVNMALLTPAVRSPSPLLTQADTERLQPQPSQFIIAAITPGQIGSRYAPITRVASESRMSPVPVTVHPELPNREAAVQIDRNDTTTSFSDGLGSTSTSRSENLTSTESASSSVDEFVEGDTVPPGKFYFNEDNAVRFYMRYILSPDEFYVQPLSHEAAATFSQLRQELAMFYDDEDHRKPCQDVDGESTEQWVGRYGVYCRRDLHSNDLDIERCEIIGWREAIGIGHARGLQKYEAQIRFIDVGPKQWVPASQIWKIEQRFCRVPAFTIRCRLFDVRPRAEGTSSAFGIWSEEAISKFRSLCDGDRPMCGYVVNKKSNGLMIYSYRGLVKVCINHELVQQKLAKTAANWNMVPLISKSDERNRSQAAAEMSAMNPNVDFLCFGPETPLLPAPSIGTIALVDIQQWFNCCRFSVNFPDGVGDHFRMERDPQYKATCKKPIEQYEEALRALNDLYARDDSMSFSRWPLVGQLVASRFTTDERYYRARMLDVAPQDNSAHVRYVDYGNDEWVTIASLRSLTPEFLALPYMAMECQLAGLRPTLRPSMNDLNSLREFISTLATGKEVLARVVHVLERARPAGPILSVILLSRDTSVNINDYIVEKKWAERVPQ